MRCDARSEDHLVKHVSSISFLLDRILCKAEYSVKQCDRAFDFGRTKASDTPAAGIAESHGDRPKALPHWSHLVSSDDIIHQSTRLRIMAVLNTLERREALEFTQLKAMIEATDGNLGAHLDTLARAGYVDIEKLFVGRRPQTRVSATTAGRRAFRGHIAFLRKIIDQAETQRRK